MMVSRVLRLTALLGGLSVALSPAAGRAQGGMDKAPQGAAKPAPLSPRDSLKTTVGGAQIMVNYGRPSKRGRELFGGLADMQWGMVWRMGANEATAFTTSKPLQLGALVVPAGSYTLRVLLQEKGPWQLVINKQTGNWGTEYKPEMDLGRIPMVMTETPAVVEKMEITVAPKGSGGELAVTWDRRRAAVAFIVK